MDDATDSERAALEAAEKAIREGRSERNKILNRVKQRRFRKSRREI